MNTESVPTLLPRYNQAYILRISFISALGGYLFGFDFAVISGALPFLRTAFHLTPWLEGLLTGSLALGCIVGCLVTGKLADRYGRKPGLVISAVIFLVSSVGMALSQGLDQFLVMRFSAGIGVGMASLLSPLYIAEISPASIRGRNVSINQLTIVLGILITNCINYFLAKNGVDIWRLMFGLGVIPAALFLFGILFLPESPRWLVKMGKEEKALRILGKIESAEHVGATVNEIRKSVETSVNSGSGNVLSKAVRPALIIGITLAVFQQFCGINVVFNYTSTIFESVGSTLNKQLFETVAIGLVNMLFTFLAMWQVDKLGRRPLMLIGSLGLAIVYLILAGLLKAHADTTWVSLLVLLAIALYASSLAPVTWVLISEIFPNNVRGSASSIAMVCLWLAYFILVFTFPILAAHLGTYGPFYLYSGVCFLGFVFIYTRVKETKGKTLEQLEGNFTIH